MSARRFEEADHEAVRLLEGLISEHRQDLVTADARITLMFAYGELNESTNKLTPPLKARGKALLGKCKINNLADRAEGKEDATITLDGDRWPRLSERTRLAILHHELLHIAAWNGKSDKDGRPKLRTRHGDWDFDGFHEVLERYGEDSIEHAHLNAVAELHRQLKLPFVEATIEIKTEAKPTARAGKRKAAAPTARP